MQSRVSIPVFFVLLVAAAPQASKVEPIFGTWKMTQQEVNGHATDPDPLTLRIRDLNKQVEFAYSTPVNNVYFVGMRFTVRLDGSEGTVMNGQGKKIGTVRITKAGRSEYKVVMAGENRPTATGKMSVSSDGKTLISESDASAPGKGTSHARQVFTRYQTERPQ